MTDQWTDRLSEYLDGELAAAERSALEAHLAGCAACASTLDELRRVVARARALDDRPPTTDLWQPIAEQIGITSEAHRVASLEQQRARRRVSFTVPQLAAAAIALMVLSGSTAWLWLGQRGAAPSSIGVTRSQTPVMMNVGTSEPNSRYAVAVADLERALARSRGQLDSGTVRVIERNLRTIDRAIRDAQSALAADPANTYLNQHLAAQMRRKVELLRRASALASARS